MINLLLPYFSALLFGFAGVCLFLLLMNRCLLLLEDSKMKTVLIFSAGLLLVGGGIVFGFCVKQLLWMLLPLGVFVLLILGEFRELFLRHIHRGSPPIQTQPHHVQLMAPITTTDLIVHRYQIALPRITRAIRIVHITDIHADQRFPRDYYKKALATAESYKADIAVFTGDFISHIKALPCLSDFIRPIASVASYAVLGNHDYWVAPDEITASLRKSGLHVLKNESVTLQIEGQPVVVTGYDYPWGTRTETIDRHDKNSLHLVLTHTPDNIYRLAECDADVVFAGHYHAGQVRLPFRGSIIIPSIYGCRFDHGHFVIGKTDLFVAAGIGASYPPIRIYCQPDMFVVDIIPGKQ
jgi:predicted MPP superfamily phosphohydrolase